VYVSEESHRGIVPRNHSNQDGASSAESEEGRLRRKENTFPFDMHPDSERDCACPTGGRVCGQAIRLAAIHLREEPDALRSARPCLCGGHRATGVPTAIVSYRSRPRAALRAWLRSKGSFSSFLESDLLQFFDLFQEPLLETGHGLPTLRIIPLIWAEGQVSTDPDLSAG